MHLCTGRVGGAFYIWFLINFLIYLCKKKKKNWGGEADFRFCADSEHMFG